MNRDNCRSHPEQNYLTLPPTIWSWRVSGKNLGVKNTPLITRLFRENTSQRLVIIKVDWLNLASLFLKSSRDCHYIFSCSTCIIENQAVTSNNKEWDPPFWEMIDLTEIVINKVNLNIKVFCAQVSSLKLKTCNTYSFITITT